MKEAAFGPLHKLRSFGPLCHHSSTHSSPIEHDQEMEHPPPLPTQTSLEDLPPPYLDYLDAAALCRLGYGTTKKQHYGVTSAVVRCATERDAVPLGATAPPGARDALELLRRRERAVCWEPFGARSQFLQRRWRRGPTTPDVARPWRYREPRGCLLYTSPSPRD